MATNNPTASGTFPFLLFLKKKLFNAIFLYSCQIFQKAHPEIRYVTPVNVAQVVARVIRAFVAILYFAIQEQTASLLELRALPVTWPAACTVGHFDTNGLNIMLTCQIGAANVAIYSAGCD